MQADRSLAGARRALDAQRLAQELARTMLSCSGWMVATMSRIGPVRGRSISDSMMSEWPTSSGSVRSSSSYAVSWPCEKPKRRRRPDAHRLAGSRLIEGPRHARTPIDHERLAARLASDVPPADVEGLVLLRAEAGVVVKPAEEERDSRIVLQGLHPAIERLLEVLGRNVVAAECLQARPCVAASARARRATPRDGCVPAPGCRARFQACTMLRCWIGACWERGATLLGRVAEKSTGFGAAIGAHAAAAIGVLVRCRPCLPLIPSAATYRSRTRRTARANPGRPCE